MLALHHTWAICLNTQPRPGANMGGGSGAAGGAALAKLAAASFIAGLASNVFKIH